MCLNNSVGDYNSVGVDYNSMGVDHNSVGWTIIVCGSIKIAWGLTIIMRG